MISWFRTAWASRRRNVHNFNSLVLLSCCNLLFCAHACSICACSWSKLSHNISSNLFAVDKINLLLYCLHLAGQVASRHLYARCANISCVDTHHSLLVPFLHQYNCKIISPALVVYIRLPLIYSMYDLLRPLQVSVKNKAVTSCKASYVGARDLNRHLLICAVFGDSDLNRAI